MRDKPPFPRLVTFCSRADILQRLCDIFHPTQCEKGDSRPRVISVLLGMGGMGKSQVALEYSYEKAIYYSSVYWVDATDDTTLATSGRRILEKLIAHYSTRYPREADFSRIATDLEIPGQINREGRLTDGDAIRAPWDVVKNWLGRDANNQWLLIFDGINDNAGATWLEKFIPVGFHGHIIITSRAVVRGCDRKHTIDIPTMDRDSSLAMLIGDTFRSVPDDCKFLRGVWGSFTDVHIVHKTARAVAEKLGYLALALAQAAAYMRSKRLNLFEYFRRLCEDISRIIGTRFPPYAEGVFSCWTLSIQALMEVNPDAITLLRFCSSLSPEGISPELLTRGLKALGWLDNGNLIPINLRGKDF